MSVHATASPRRRHRYAHLDFCPGCRQLVPIDNFQPHGLRRSGHQTHCEDCNRAADDVGRNLDPDRGARTTMARNAALEELRRRHLHEFAGLYDEQLDVHEVPPVR